MSLFVSQTRCSAAMYRIRSCSAVACSSRRTICPINILLSSSSVIVYPPTSSPQWFSRPWQCAARSPRLAVCHPLPPP
nr:MAG TPA: hypothetical protein [Phage sp. ctucZ11]